MTTWHSEHAGGDKAIEVASAILHKRPYERENILSTDLVTKDNARIMQMQTEHIANLDKKINVLDSKLATILQRISLQRTILAAGAVIIILICTLLAIAVSAFRTKSRMNCKLTRQKAQLEEQRARLVDLTAKLEQATQAKLAFFTNVSHDIRTPLTLIADPVERLIADPEITPRQRTLLENIRQSTAILLRLVGQILDFRKYETGMLKPKFTSINIVSAICEWTKSFASLAGEGGTDSAMLSVGISEALVNTAAGIATAAFALIGYNFYTNKIDKLTFSLDEVGFTIVQTFSATH